MNFGPSIKLNKADDFILKDSKFADHEDNITIFFLDWTKVAMAIADEKFVAGLQVLHACIGQIGDLQNRVGGFDIVAFVQATAAERHAAVKIAVFDL